MKKFDEPCGYRPFPTTGDFYDCVVNMHAIDNDAYVFRTVEFFRHVPDNPKQFLIVQADIPTNQNTSLLQVAFDHTKVTNSDITVAWVDWSEDEEAPAAISGRVHFSVPLIKSLYASGIRELRFCKAMETLPSGGKIVSVAFKAYDAASAEVSCGNLTSMNPIAAEEMFFLP
jgi:hypothetical protein